MINGFISKPCFTVKTSFFFINISTFESWLSQLYLITTITVGMVWPSKVSSYFNPVSKMGSFNFINE